MTGGLTISGSATLDAQQVTAVLALVGEAAASDGFSALNEAALLNLRHRRAGLVHLLALQSAELVGYGQLDDGLPLAAVTSPEAGVTEPGVTEPGANQGGTAEGDEPATTTGQLVVGPTRRRTGVGSALLAEMVRTSPRPLRLWAMGDTAAARALADKHDLVRARELLIMTRSLTEPVSVTLPPPGVVVRSFVVGRDEQEWLGVNSRAFSEHPEQGRLTRADLDDRIAEGWFEAAGFFVATRDERMLGFHWTKQHPGRLGEVYVLGVDPAAGDRGLGKALLARGLSHLRDRGDTSVQLYVEADHVRAVALYAGYGFTVNNRDVMYAQPSPVPASLRSVPGGS